MSENSTPIALDTASRMRKLSASNRPECPVGEPVCAVIDEVMSLRDQVVTDPLTGLYNVRYFRAALDQELERTERTQVATALMMIDLDHFKQVNDTWGHEAGNEVLKQTARIIRDCTRKLDIQCRYGGEEFVVILPSTERRLGVQVAERIRQNIEDTPVMVNGDVIRLTTSIGLAFHSAESLFDASGLIACADEYLYEAKRGGRNRVCYSQLHTADTAVTGEEKDAFHDLFGGAPDSGDMDEQDFAGEDSDDDWMADDQDWPDDSD
ncbi:GGDEF domain-containing protein [Thalassolituus marinus]|nr:GGDEF domain-containing protein [Thalassolituus marinus]